MNFTGYFTNFFSGLLKLWGNCKFIISHQKGTVMFQAVIHSIGSVPVEVSGIIYLKTKYTNTYAYYARIYVGRISLPHLSQTISYQDSLNLSELEITSCILFQMNCLKNR